MSYYRRERMPGSTYFFTLTLANRQTALLTDEIARLRLAYAYTRQRLPFETVAICILPDHLHAIWSLPEGDADYTQRWSLFKSHFSRELPAAPMRSASKVHKREKGIWQRRYWEHRIRDDLDLQRHVDYIHYNPVKHGLIERVCGWRYSSFHRYVDRGLLPKDWASPDESSDLFGE